MARAQLFAACRDEEHDKALQASEQLIRDGLQGPDIYLAKCVALVLLGCFEDALQFIDSLGDEDLAAKLKLHRAYCLYRLNRIEESSACVQSAGDAISEETRRLILMQNLYREQKYAESANLAEALDSGDDEVAANLIACLVCAGEGEKACNVRTGDGKRDMFEITFNRACAAVENGDLDTATALLETAESTCVKSLTADDYTEEEIKTEILPIQTLRLCVRHERGETGDLLAEYVQLIKNKSFDPVSGAVAANNAVVLKGARDLFESFRRMRPALGSELSARLTRAQKLTFAVNFALLQFYGNKKKQLLEYLTEMQGLFPDEEAFPLIEAASLLRDNQANAAVEVLQKFIDAHRGAGSIAVLLALSHSLEISGDTIRAASVLRLDGVDEGRRNDPGVAASAARLLLASGDFEGACVLLRSAADFWTADAPHHRRALLGELARVLEERGVYDSAASVLEEILPLHADATEASETLARLVAALARFDAGRAAEMRALMPQPERVLNEKQIDVLERLSAAVLGKRAQSTRATVATPARNLAGTVSDQDGEPPLRRRAKKKRKPRLPKNFDPEVQPDPERWLPKRERERTGRRGRRAKAAAFVQQAAPVPAPAPSASMGEGGQQTQGSQAWKKQAARKKKKRR